MARAPASTGTAVAHEPRGLSSVFSDAKEIDSRILNRLGVQPFRAVTARTLHRLQPTESDPVTEQVATQGFAVVEDYLPPAEFEAAVAEVDRFVERHLPTWMHTFGSTAMHQYALGPTGLEEYPRLDSWRNDPRLLRWASALERRHAFPTGSMIEIAHVTDGDAPDPQSRLHVDAIYNTHKAWLYLQDVTEEIGPLVYVPGSQRLDATRLVEEYRHSNDPNRCLDPSRRIGDEEVRRRRLEPQMLVCKANTLVIANTCGYHRRAPGQPGATRRALHAWFRANPFAGVAPAVRQLVGSISTRGGDRSRGVG